MKTMPKNAETFYYEIYDFTCSKKSNYENHINTAKHGNRTISSKKMPNIFVNVEKDTQLEIEIVYGIIKKMYLLTSRNTLST